MWPLPCRVRRSGPLGREPTAAGGRHTSMIRRLVLLVTLAGALVVGGAPRPAAACSCATVSAAEHAADAEVVFSGRLVQSLAPSTRDDGTFSTADRVRHDFAVDRVYKGETAAEITVTSARAEASCGVQFQPGRHLVFASRDGDELSTNLCSGTRPIAVDEDPAGLGVGRAPPAPTTSTTGPSDDQPRKPVREITAITERDVRWERIALVVAALCVVAGFAVMLVRRRRTQS